MTRLGFLLDSDSCIGCHACTVACKSEHDVPLGVNRTWVKYIETGSFPNVSRHFSVMRCNQCDDAPCMEICPTSALFRAPNGVVDFNDDNCIGCKACMNACPYDALYINPETNTAHKCNFCNHRIEDNLEPSCVVVCPTEAIVVGDLDDPNSKISTMIARNDVAVRAPEQNTQPKVYYKGAHMASLDPLATSISADGMIWADTTEHHPTPPNHEKLDARTAYTTAHPITWKEKVSGYLVTKAIAGGVMIIAALLALLGNDDFEVDGVQSSIGVVPPIVAGIFLAITGALLVADLKQPKRFYYLITKGNRSSWLVKGAYVLMAFAIATGLWWLGGLAESETLIKVMIAPVAILGFGVAGYTAFLFGQCEGRDLWQTPLLLPTLLCRAVVAGGATYAILDLFLKVPDAAAIRWAFLAGLIGVALLTWAELASTGSRHVEMAVHEMVKGDQAKNFWFGALIGLVAPGVMLIIDRVADVDSAPLAAIAGLFALVGMFFAETAFVRAGQSVPLS